LKFLFIPEHNQKFSIVNSVILPLMELQVHDKAQNIKIIAFISGSNTKDEQQLLMKDIMVFDLIPIRCHLVVLTC